MNQHHLKQRAKELVERMTLEEKASLCSGRDCWTLKPIERLGLESIVMMDGPHGLRKQIGEGDNLGIGDSVPSVCFPTASATACSFDRELLHELGKAMGEECVQEGVSILLGPGVNQKRSPLCGRNFEYFSEDSLVSGELAASMIQGIQSTGTGASLKHFAVNNQEKRRMSVSAVVDERTLRETYLKAFEIAVKKGKPDTVMCSYNKLNGEYCSENKYLLTDILREEWGFEGAVISDWGAVHNRALGVQAGLDLEMPGNDGYNDAKVVEAVRNGTLAIEALDQTACRVTELILKGMENRKEGYRYDVDKHHELAVKAAAESAVLLKNKGNLLPGNPKQKAAVIGLFAKKPRYQGAGSSRLHPIQVDTAWDELTALGLEADYAQGYSVEAIGRNGKATLEQDQWIREACETARDKDIVYLFVGLTEGYESEGFDRTTMSMPEEHNRLVEAVCACNPNVVVILSGGAPMELPWLSKVRAVLLGYLNGEGGGKAIAHLLLGISVPCGKLAETWPMKQEDVPCDRYFPGGRLTVEHRESIYVGYRYYEKAGKPVQFPFGHGLSYTEFRYSNLRIDRSECHYGEKLMLTFQVTNVGGVAAKETAFLFVAHENDNVFLPKKELIEFGKVELQPWETKELSVTVDTHSFGYYNTKINDWYAESGDYLLLVGGALDKTVLQASLHLTSPMKPQPDLKSTAPSYFALENKPFEVSHEEFEALYAKKLPVSDSRARRPFTENNTLEDIQHTFIGKLVIAYANRMAAEVTKDSPEQKGMMLAMFMEMPFFAMVSSGEGMISERMMHGVIDLLNGQYGRGIRRLLGK
ncbi:glycoside hydrolase family 3 C-terminal domain-containing protein [Gorillibacterium timonense]|uniref:glycoside hydrolase family 3 C-terminal domain-containing protein n=1 Tax=Gorillibacterium timonense TaxID=1689269 RepID=UPI00071CC039|nr:glycoside hydrolase family 3 C-terminal domain-containing protein [Gorillibacterium timonense]